MANVRMAAARVATMRPWVKKTEPVLVNKKPDGQSRTSLELSNDATFDGLDTDGMRSNNHEYVFPEWVKGFTDDLDAVRRAFDSNGDGKLTQTDARWGQFKVMVANANGTTEAKTLSQLGITEINLTANATQQVFLEISVLARDRFFQELKSGVFQGTYGG